MTTTARRVPAVLALAWGIVLFVVGPAVAQTPVTGAGDFNDAPMLDARAWVDLLVPGETAVYAVEVAVGQQLVVDAELAPDGDVGTANAPARLSLHDPLRRTEDALADAAPIDQDGAVSLAADIPVAVDDARTAGRWYVVVRAPDADTEASGRYRLDLVVDVRGEAAAPIDGPEVVTTVPPAPDDPPTPEPTATSRRGGGEAATAPSPAEPVPTGSDGGSSSVLFGGVAFLVGGGVGFGGVRLAARRR